MENINLWDIPTCSKLGYVLLPNTIFDCLSNFIYRKNQIKRVCQVPAEESSSDLWCWRKYGQKPIKGSPYPRYLFSHLQYFS